MLSSIMFVLFSFILFIFTPETCVSEAPPSSLFLYSPGSPDFTDVIMKRVGDNLTLVCELRGDGAPPALFVWSYVPANDTAAKDSPPYTVQNNGTFTSELSRSHITEADSGRYVCAAPPHSHAKYILVQRPGGHLCAPSALRCGRRCVLATNVCDGRADCLDAEDEAEHLCGPRPCDRPERLNCSGGRCIPAGACCATPHPLCRQHSCCLDHHPRTPLDLELLPPFEDRRAPDDYGFIQSTIYTVTACALIFMIAVVLLVSAICKMHMKRAALRSYTHADHRYNVNVGVQRHRFPPCYDAAELLEHPPSPDRDNRCTEELPSPSPTHSECRSTRLSTLANVFSSRYRQVPTQCAEVEMLPVLPAPPPNDADPQHDRHRLTLQLGRFHLSIPSFRREPRPDTPNIAEINIDDLDFVRLNTNETYTLNGRTIRLLNGNFENIPVLNNPPPYNEAVRYKLYGPPPEYLSRDRLNRSNSEENARSNIEMPPGYEEFVNCSDEASNVPSSSYCCVNVEDGSCSGLRSELGMANGNEASNIGNEATNIGIGASSIVIGATNVGIGSTNVGIGATNVGIGATNVGNEATNAGTGATYVGIGATNVGNITTSISSDTIANATSNGNITPVEETATDFVSTEVKSSIINDTNNGNDNSIILPNINNESVNNNTSFDNNNETLNSVIDNLPAIDSDVNANDEVSYA